MIVAGEPSGDLQAALLLEQLRSRRPSWSFFGIGGPRMAEQGFAQFVGIEEMAVIGFADVVRKFFFFRRVFTQAENVMKQRKPDAVLLVDYPGFNVRLARRASRHGFRVVYYIAPQIWAWGEDRINTLRKNIGLLVPVFPFEQDYFESRGIPTRRVGHPLLDIVKPAMDRCTLCKSLGVSVETQLLALLPGSRPAEVRRHVPIMLATARLLAAEYPALVPVVSCAPGINKQELQEMAGKFLTRDLAISRDTYSLVAAADLALVKSGTATIECAMLGTPFIAMYKTGALNYQIARRLIRTEHIAMVNLVAGKTVVPEFIQHDATPQNLARAAQLLLTDEGHRAKMIEELAEVRDKLGPAGGAGQAADIIIEWLEETARGSD
jgi:lipid-A-disaccharide synthase